jgi:hypothetical protein
MGNSPENRAFDVTANRLHTQRRGVVGSGQLRSV